MLYHVTVSNASSDENLVKIMTFPSLIIYV